MFLASNSRSKKLGQRESKHSKSKYCSTRFRGNKMKALRNSRVMGFEFKSLLYMNLSYVFMLCLFCGLGGHFASWMAFL
jgi:hypothetical protein